MTTPTIQGFIDRALKPYRSSAEFSPCRTWRYSLTRIWDDSLPLLAVIGLNPSTADETQDDPTVRRCMRFADSWGMGGLVMLNLFAFRATDPRAMKAVPLPIGHLNDATLLWHTRGRMVLCAWGNHGGFLDRADHVVRRLREVGRELVCLGLTKSGQPKHPLYLRADLRPIPLPEVAR